MGAMKLDQRLHSFRFSRRPADQLDSSLCTAQLCVDRVTHQLGFIMATPNLHRVDDDSLLSVADNFRWEVLQTDSQTWCATVYLGDVVYGSASGATKAAAQDEATLQAYNKLKAFLILPGLVREIGDRVVADHSSLSDAISISESQPILKPKGGLVSSHLHDTQLCIDLYPTADLKLAVDDSDDTLQRLTKYMEGDNFNLREIANLLSSTDLPNLLCAGLQLLEHAAKWQKINFDECISVTFGPVADLVLDSRDSEEVHCAALNTLKLFLESPHAADIATTMMPRGIVDTVSSDLSSPEAHVQLASVELLEVASRSGKLLNKFSAPISRIPGALPSMPTDTQVTALRVIELSAGSNEHEVIKALTSNFHYLKELLSSPEVTVQTAALKVLEASARNDDLDLSRAVQTLPLDIKKSLSPDEADNASSHFLPDVMITASPRSAYSVMDSDSDSPPPPIGHHAAPPSDTSLLLNVHDKLDTSSMLIHRFKPQKIPYPRSYERVVLDLDILDTQLICEMNGGSLTWHTFPPSWNVPMPGALKKVLDIGCGDGTWVVEAAKCWRGCEVIGLDIVSIHPNLEHDQGGDEEIAKRVTWVQANFLEGLPFDNDTFNFVHIKRIARGVPQDKWKQLFEEIFRVMKPGGAFEVLEEDLSFPEHDRSKARIPDQRYTSSPTEMHRSISSIRPPRNQKANAAALAVLNEPNVAFFPQSKIATIKPPKMQKRAPVNIEPLSESNQSFFLLQNRSGASSDGRDEDDGGKGREKESGREKGKMSFFRRTGKSADLPIQAPPAEANQNEGAAVETGKMSFFRRQVPKKTTLGRPPPHRRAEFYQENRNERAAMSGDEGRPLQSILIPSHEMMQNPRNHAILEIIYNQMHEERCIHLSPLGILTNAVESLFVNVRTSVFRLPPSEDMSYNNLGILNPIISPRGLYNRISPHASLEADTLTETRSHLPNPALNIGPRSLNLHLALRVKEIVACAEAMWEWVQGRKERNDGEFARILELTRQEFDELVLRFELDMREHVKFGSVPEDRFNWSVIPGPTPQESSSFDIACEKWDAYQGQENGIIHAMSHPAMRLSRTLGVFVAWKPIAAVD